MPTMPAGSILLGSTRANELRDWYLRVLAPDHTGDGPIVLGDLMLVIERRDDVSDTNPEPGRSILNFHVDDFALFEAQLSSSSPMLTEVDAEVRAYRSRGSGLARSSRS